MRFLGTVVTGTTRKINIKKQKRNEEHLDETLQTLMFTVFRSLIFIFGSHGSCRCVRRVAGMGGNRDCPLEPLWPPRVLYAVAVCAGLDTPCTELHPRQ